MTDKEAKRAYGGGFVLFLVLSAFVIMGVGCAGTEKPVDQLRDLVCPPTFMEEYKAAERASDRLEDALLQCKAETETYNMAHKRCIDRLNKGLSKSSW